jgi:hypothetical protein
MAAMCQAAGFIAVILVGLMHMSHLTAVLQGVKLFPHNMRLHHARLNGEPEHEHEAENTFHEHGFRGWDF